VTRHKSQASARALEGIKPLGKAHRHPPDLLDLRIDDPIVLKLDIVISEAQKTVFVVGEHARPDPWPGLDAITSDSDVYTRRQYCSKGSKT
jgi:hypothetical protein